MGALLSRPVLQGIGGGCRLLPLNGGRWVRSAAVEGGGEIKAETLPTIPVGLWSHGPPALRSPSCASPVLTFRPSLTGGDQSGDPRWTSSGRRRRGRDVQGHDGCGGGPTGRSRPCCRAPHPLVAGPQPRGPA